MKIQQQRHAPKRLVAALVTGAMLLQTAVPAYATVMQVPGIYLPPPSPNVMFSLDDSGSMTSDAIPDFGGAVPGMPTNNASASLDGYGSQFPGMWKPNSEYLNPNRTTGNLYQSDNHIARYMRSSAGNPLYYDPTVTYRPWPRADDDTQTFPAANPASVLIHHSSPRLANGTVNTNATTVDLTTQRTRTATAIPGNAEANAFWPATYYVYTGTTPLSLANPADPNNIQSNFRKVEIPGTGTSTFDRAPTRTDCTGDVLPATGGCTREQEMQNFANWLQYYRSRMLMAKGGVASAFSRQGTNLRVGFTSINSSTITQRVATFSGTARTTFYTNLYSESANGSTPLRVAMDRVGQYFSITGVGSPWGENTAGSPRPREDSCRKSFHILSTDGFWNDRDVDVREVVKADHDFFGTAEVTPPQPDGRTYQYRDDGTAGTLDARFTVSPYRDNNTSNVNTLANVAAYYWKTDLQAGAAGLENRIAVSSRDPAYWQHLTTFTVGLGVSGTGSARPSDIALSDHLGGGRYVVSNSLPTTSPFYAFRGKPWLSDPDLRDLLIARKTPMTWPTTANGGASTGDDLIHAAMNGHGRYLSATNPSDLAAGLASALAEATDQVSSFASLGLANTSETAANNRLFQAVYNPYGWTGRLYAYGLSSGSFSTNPADALWEASKAMPAPANRSIFTWNAEAATPQGAPFTWSGLNATQQAALGPTSGAGSSTAERQDVLDYLRGSIDREVQSGGPLRDRVRDQLPSGALGGVLGDIVGGSPLKGPDYGGGYERMRPATPGRDIYAGATGYRTPDEVQSRIGTMRQSVFFSANDGMLHAVNANNGVERFAFVPNSVFSVPRTTYNGTTTTVKKLYELSRPDYNHLFTVNGPPQIADAYVGPNLGSQEWRSILVGSTGAGARSVFAIDVTNPQVGAATNPFNTGKILWEFSEAQNADMGHMPSYPHVAKMQDGTWVAMFGNGHDSSTGRAKLFLLDLYTGAVVWEQAVGATGGNGLSQPNFLLNQYREVVAIWAGDLRGNMWKFDVNSPNRSDWHVAFGGNPLFTTPTNQPITVMPELARFPNTNQAMVLFGTGKLFDTQDNATDSTNQNLTRQALYGIWDNESTRVTSRSQLVEQTVLPGNTNSYRRTSENTIDWATQRGWFLQLEDGTGERVHVNPLIPVEGRAVPAFFVANTPGNIPCGSGGTSRVFALDPITGQTPRFSVFDTNRQDGINAADGRNNVMSVSVGILSLPSFLVGRTSGGVVSEKPGSRGQTGAREGGVEFRDGSGSMACSSASNGRMIAGVSDTSAVNETVKLSECKGRVSWRQIQ